MQAKQLAKGRTPGPMDDGRVGWRPCCRAAAWASTATSCSARAERLRLIVGAAAGTLNPFASPEAREASGHTLELQSFRFVKDNTPFANVWYARLALDYLVLWRMQEAISPGYLARYEANVREREGSDFLVAPTDAVQ
jgi:hypothetical protein